MWTSSTFEENQPNNNFLILKYNVSILLDDRNIVG